MSQNVNSLYLGWGNERFAIRVKNHSIIILANGDRSSVLTGNDAKNFLADHRDLTHHLVGIKKSKTAAMLVNSTKSDIAAYNKIFDRHFDLGQICQE